MGRLCGIVRTMPVYPAVKRVWMGKTMIKKQLRLIPAAVLALTLVLSLMGWDAAGSLC